MQKQGKTYPVFNLKTRSPEGLVDVGGVFLNTAKSGSTYYSVSKTPYRLFKNDDGSYALTKRGEGEKAGLTAVATLKEKEGKSGVTYYAGQGDGQDFVMFPYDKQA